MRTTADLFLAAIAHQRTSHACRSTSCDAQPWLLSTPQLSAPPHLAAAAIARADSDAGSDAGLPSLKSDSAEEDDMDEGGNFDDGESEASIPSLAADDAASDSEGPGLTDDEDDEERSSQYDSEMPGLKEHTEEESEDGGECRSAAGGLQALVDVAQLAAVAAGRTVSACWL